MLREERAVDPLAGRLTGDCLCSVLTELQPMTGVGRIGPGARGAVKSPFLVDMEPGPYAIDRPLLPEHGNCCFLNGEDAGSRLLGRVNRDLGIDGRLGRYFLTGQFATLLNRY